MFIFVCKDNDELHCEFFDFDEYSFKQYEERAGKIIFSNRAPFKLSDDPAFFGCRFCSAKEFCHETQLTKEVNCRTCANSTPTESGEWNCGHWGADIPDFDAQMTGCDNHIIHPDLTPGWAFERTEKGVIWMTEHGKIENSPDGYLSSEIVANHEACASGIRDKYQQFDARVVG